MVLSLKAGGVGLNLTEANHVVHFDRWWNPAVENQATDRAFRIGQQKNVVVHKFITQGTIEEKIDAMLEEKARMSEEVMPLAVKGGSPNWTTTNCWTSSAWASHKRLAQSFDPGPTGGEGIYTFHRNTWWSVSPLIEESREMLGVMPLPDLLDLKVHVRIPALEDGAQFPVERPHARL